ncbi:hypothetical protein K1W54_04755 [Micromonospora sp. CPCC 205371]|nr:hypothetical protein [Micromonospora sp. CPCC 205371]
MGLLDQQVPHADDQNTLNLTAAELHAVAEAVESLTQVRGSVSAIEVGGLQVGLRRTSNQYDGDQYVITSIARTPR